MGELSEKELKKYYKQIKSNLPMYTSKEKKFISDLQSSVCEYIEAKPECIMDDIVERFGTPNEIVQTYLEGVEDIDPKKLKLYRRKIKIIIGVLLVALITVTAYTIYIHSDANGHSKTVITVYEDN